MGVSGCRCWSLFIAFEGNYHQKLTNLLEIDFSDTPTKGLAWYQIMRLCKQVTISDLRGHTGREEPTCCVAPPPSERLPSERGGGRDEVRCPTAGEPRS